MMNTETHHIFSRNFSLRVLNLDQIEKVSEEERSGELYYWARMLKAETWEEIQMLAEKCKAIGEAAEHLREPSEDEKIQLQCEGRERYYMDMSCSRNEGRAEGRTEGLAEGRAEGLMEGQNNAQIAINNLNQKLINDGRLEDLRRSAGNTIFQQQLMEEYGIHFGDMEKVRIPS